ncbi:hypothetical protein FXF51_56925 [Nonomuraea sp. PA05]|uniref:hypothetical protein n=1 Tax=Nonomuraea sp. PA05 TaxID=2604466 RepID=UPI0011DBCC07|nr:hypothetical protein [Nonomuraea sp. PA05]TYB50265.1 hypothetical protein FXF51_56925 [Nonomuraea sp. PA05]
MNAAAPQQTSELISAEEFNALMDKVLKHDTYCPCRYCRRMDALMTAMCNEAFCRKEALPGRWGCDDHPHHGPAAASAKPGDGSEAP